jgi:hypothetical protein
MLDHFRVRADTEWRRVSASTVSTSKPVGACTVVWAGIGEFGAFVVLAALCRGDDRGPPQDIGRNWLLGCRVAPSRRAGGGPVRGVPANPAL